MPDHGILASDGLTLLLAGGLLLLLADMVQLLLEDVDLFVIHDRFFIAMRVGLSRGRSHVHCIIANLDDRTSQRTIHLKMAVASGLEPNG